MTTPDMTQLLEIHSKELEKLQQELDAIRAANGIGIKNAPTWVVENMAIRPADGSDYRGKIVYASKEEDTVRHQCDKTGKIYEKSYFGFLCRYMPVEDPETT